jgi:hypothetical protein
MKPMLNLSFWTEDIEVKDVAFSINRSNGRALSFLIKKYHDERYVKEHDLDKMFDEITESDLAYGGVLVQKAKGRPEVFKLNTIAFCDQTDILGGPLAFKHYFSPGKLRKMSSLGWGSEANGATVSIDDLIVMATADKDAPGTELTKTNRVPGKTIEIYIVRGDLPVAYLQDNDDFETYSTQLHIVGFYTDSKNKKEGVTLYRKKDNGDNVLFFTSEEIPGRALGYGVGESLLHPQAWTNLLTIHKTRMLEAGAKVPLYTDDPDYTNRNQIQDMENLEITTISEGRRIFQVPTAAVANIQLYENSINEWFEHSQLIGAAFDPVLGKEAASGTTFRGQERTVAQGRGLHDRRRGQRAKFIETIYRKWIIPDIIKEILGGKEFLATLSTEELTWVRQQMQDVVVEKQLNEDLYKAVLDDKAPIPTQQRKEQLKVAFNEGFAKQGNRRLIKILEGEFKNIPIEIDINIAGKQKDLVNLTDKILSIFQFVFANPQGFQQAMQIPALAKSFSDILEFSGLSVADFSTLVAPTTQTQSAPQTPQPQLALNQPQSETI